MIARAAKAALLADIVAVWHTLYLMATTTDTATAAKIQSWEIAGVSVFPVVQAVLALEIPAHMGITENQFLQAVIALFTLAAIIRGFLTKAKIASTTITTTVTNAQPLAATTTVELPATAEPRSADSVEELRG
jgi:hypothetical protein